MGEVIRLTPSNTRCATCGQTFVAPTTILYQDGKAYHQGACPTPDPQALHEPCVHAVCPEDRCTQIAALGVDGTMEP